MFSLKYLFYIFVIVCCLVLNASVTLSNKRLLNVSILFASRVSTIFSAKSFRIKPLNGSYFGSCSNANLHFLCFWACLFATTDKFECPVSVSMCFSSNQKYIILTWISLIASMLLFSRAILLMIFKVVKIMYTFFDSMYFLYFLWYVYCFLLIHHYFSSHYILFHFLIFFFLINNCLKFFMNNFKFY